MRRLHQRRQRPCEDCGVSVFWALSQTSGGWRLFEFAAIEDDRRALSYVLVGRQAWRRVDLIEHWHVTREISEDQARDLVDDYPHHILHVHTREDDDT